MSEYKNDILNQQFISQIIDSMVDGVFITDLKGLITFWNPSMEKISGYKSREVLGKSCQILQCSDCYSVGSPEMPEEKHGLPEPHQSDTRECVLRHRDGHDVPVVKKASTIHDEKGSIVGVIEAVIDISELKKARREADEASFRLGEIHRMSNIICKSDEMYDLFTAIRAAADTRTNVIIYGESGTGKELVAGAIHYASARKNYPFIAVNCSALSEQLLESELFGHLKGALSGALRDRTGRIEEAEGGSIFLDEVGELSPFIQVKLLRLLQEKKMERIGESRVRNVDVRIIAATHKNLQKMVQQGIFREDLYYRLNTLPIEIPPLRNRKEDIPLLVSHFIKQLNTNTGRHILGVDKKAMRALMDHTWPGNVRELQNALEYAFVLCKEDRICPDDLPSSIRMYSKVSAGSDSKREFSPQNAVRTNLTKSKLLDLLHENGWNKLAVSRIVGVSHTSIWKYMKKWDIPLKRPE